MTIKQDIIDDTTAHIKNGGEKNVAIAYSMMRIVLKPVKYSRWFTSENNEWAVVDYKSGYSDQHRKRPFTVQGAFYNSRVRCFTAEGFIHAMIKAFPEAQSVLDELTEAIG